MIYVKKYNWKLVKSVRMESVAKGKCLECNCDPLKRVLQWFLIKIIECYCLPVCELNKVQLFYKSSVFRYPVHQCCLKFKVSQETLRTLKLWAEDCMNQKDSKNRLELGSSAGGLESPDDIVKRVSSDLPSNVQCISADPMGNFTFSLNSSLLKEPVVRWALTAGHSWNRSTSCHNKLYKVEIGMTQVTVSQGDDYQSLVNFRKVLLARTVATICKKVGYYVDEKNYLCIPNQHLNDKTIFIIGRSIDPAVVGKAASSCGKVSNRGNYNGYIETALQFTVGGVAAKESIHSGGCMSLNEIENERLSEMKDISEARRSKSLSLSTWFSSIIGLAKATIHYDILVKPIEADVILVPLKATQMNHDGLIIMYNYARLLSILRRFEDEVAKSVYPPLPTLSDVEFIRIGEKNEELELFQLLLEWPRVLESVVSFVRLECRLFMIPKFLLALANSFNKFYNEPSTAPHNFPEMMARVYFLKAIRNTFEDCLEIMQATQVCA